MKKGPRRLPAWSTERSGTRRNYKLGLINYVSTICRSPPPPGLINGLNKMGRTHLLEGSNMCSELGPRKASADSVLPDPVRLDERTKTTGEDKKEPEIDPL